MNFLKKTQMSTDTHCNQIYCPNPIEKGCIFCVICRDIPVSHREKIDKNYRKWTGSVDMVKKCLCEYCDLYDTFTSFKIPCPMIYCRNTIESGDKCNECTLDTSLVHTILEREVYKNYGITGIVCTECNQKVTFNDAGIDSDICKKCL
jgi:RecJ-like exonuclease